MVQQNAVINLDVSHLLTYIKEFIREELKSLNKEQKNDNDILSREQCKKFLGVSLTTLHNWNATGKLKSKKIGSRVYYNKQDVLNTLNS